MTASRSRPARGYRAAETHHEGTGNVQPSISLGTDNRRNLPGHTVDRIRDGVPAADLKVAGEKAVYKGLVSTAASAIAHGWPETDWTALLDETRSTLGRQARITRKHRERNTIAWHKVLHNAWTKAETWLATAPAAHSPDSIARHTSELRAIIADPDAALTDNQRAVLDYACTTAAEKSTTRPALPWRAVAEGTGLSERTTKTTLTALDRAGILHVEIRGGAKIKDTNGKLTERRKASLYRLPDPAAVALYLYRETRCYGTPRPGDMGPLESPALGHPHRSYGTPTEETMPETVSLTGTPEALARAIQLLAEQRVPVDTAPVSDGTPAVDRRLRVVADRETRQESA